MSMNTIIQKKRRELGITQEQVAEHLGVSIPAVSKWETGQTCPDITLLPQLARLLKVDLNTLFEFQETLSPAEIRSICDSIIHTGQTEGLVPAFTLAQQHLREFPHDEMLLYNVTLCTDGLLNMPNLPPEVLSAYEEQILSSYETLADSADPAIRNSANFMLASKSIRQGNYDRAQAVLDRMPDKRDVTRDIADKLMLQIQVYQHQGKFTEATTELQYDLFAAVNRVQLLMGQLLNLTNAAGNSEDAARITEKITAFSQLFELWEYYSCVNHFQSAVKAQDVSLALPLARELLKTLSHPWQPQNTLLFQNVTWNIDSNQTKHLFTVLLTSLEQESEFAFLRKNPEFIDLLKKYHV